MRAIVKQARVLYKQMGVTSVAFLMRKFKITFETALEVYRKTKRRQNVPSVHNRVKT